jgi:hypothetical protein
MRSFTVVQDDSGGVSLIRGLHICKPLLFFKLYKN